MRARLDDRLPHHCPTGLTGPRTDTVSDLRVSVGDAHMCALKQTKQRTSRPPACVKAWLACCSLLNVERVHTYGCSSGARLVVAMKTRAKKTIGRAKSMFDGASSCRSLGPFWVSGIQWDWEHVVRKRNKNYTRSRVRIFGYRAPSSRNFKNSKPNHLSFPSRGDDAWLFYSQQLSSSVEQTVIISIHS